MMHRPRTFQPLECLEEVLQLPPDYNYQMLAVFVLRSGLDIKGTWRHARKQAASRLTLARMRCQLLPPVPRWDRKTTFCPAETSQMGTRTLHVFVKLKINVHLRKCPETSPGGYAASASQCAGSLGRDGGTPSRPSLGLRVACSRGLHIGFRDE